PRAKRRNDEAIELDAISEINCGDFRLKLKTDVIFVNDRRLEVQANAILFEYDRDSRAITAATLYDRHWKLATREKTGLLAVHRNEVRLSQLAQRALLLHSSNHAHCIAAHHEEVECAGERAAQDAARHFLQSAWPTTCVGINACARAALISIRS